MRLEREDGLPRIVVRRFADGEEHEIAFDEEAYSLGISAGYEYDTPTLALHLFVDDDAGPGVRLRHGRAQARCCARRRRSRAATIPRSTSRAASWRRPRTARRCRSRCSTARTRKLDGSAPLLLYGYGAYGMTIPAGFSHQRAQPGRSRLRLCHRPCARRQGQGLSLVQGRQARQEDEHLHRLHRRRRISRRSNGSPRAAASSPMAAAPAAC